jgi:C1A family cysteine protease
MATQHRLGCLKDPYDHRDLSMSVFLKAVPLPERVDHSDLLPPIFDQGPAGTCVACAAGYYDKTFQEGLEHRWPLADPVHQFSPSFIYSQRRNRSGDHGMTIREAMKIVKDMGVCSLEAMPYVLERLDQPPTPAQLKAALPYRSKSYARLGSIGEMETYLLGNCFIAGVMVHEGFMDAPGGMIPMPTPRSDYLGGHAVCVIGYDRRNHMFKFVNSWGAQWGDRGFGHIGYATLQALLMDAWGMVDGPDGETQ